MLHDSGGAQTPAAGGGLDRKRRTADTKAYANRSILIIGQLYRLCAGGGSVRDGAKVEGRRRYSRRV